MMSRIIRAYIKTDSAEVIGPAGTVIPYSNNKRPDEKLKRQKQKYMNCEYVENTKVDYLDGSMDILKRAS